MPKYFLDLRNFRFKNPKKIFYQVKVSVSHHMEAAMEKNWRKKEARQREEAEEGEAWRRRKRGPEGSWEQARESKPKRGRNRWGSEASREHRARKQMDLKGRRE